MNRSLYQPGVEVAARTLTYDIDSRIEDTDQIVVDHGSTGVVDGLVTSVNGVNPLRIDVSAGYGYTTAGERVVLAAAQLNIALADDTAVTGLNYVMLMYDESYQLPEAHETDGTTRDTQAVVTPRLVVLDSTEYGSLPLNDDVLTNNCINRMLLLAVVTGNGTGVPLSAASVVAPTGFSSTIQVSQPLAISGVIITSVDTTTSIGTGQLSYIVATKAIAWQAPGEGSAGASIVLTGNGVITLTSSGGHTLVISVSFLLLPPTGTTVTDNIYITALYSQTVTRFTNQDFYHRSMIGSGLPSVKNPHGLTIQDLDPNAPTLLEVHQRVEHSNGIASGSSIYLLEGTVNTTGTPDTVKITDFVGGDAVYINGHIVGGLSSSDIILFPSGGAPTPTTVYGIYLTSLGVVYSTPRIVYQLLEAFIGLNLQVINCSDSIGSTSLNLTWDTANEISFNGGPSRTAPAINTRMRLYSLGMTSWIDVFVRGTVVAPALTKTETLQFYAEPSVITDFPLSYAWYSGSADGMVGYGFDTISHAPNMLVDRRVFGTLSASDVSSTLAAVPRDSHSLMFGNGAIPIVDGADCYSGRYGETDVCTDQLVLGTVASSAATLTGGMVVVDGKYFNIASTLLSFVGSTTGYVYINSSGTVKCLAATTSWDNIAAAEGVSPSVESQKSILRLFDVLLDGAGNEISRNDYLNGNIVYQTGGQWISHRKNVPYGVVGLNRYGAATIASTDTIALYVRTTGTTGVAAATTNAGASTGLSGVAVGVGSSGLLGQSAGTNGFGVHGVVSAAGSIGVQGTAASAATIGVKGTSTVASSTGVYGVSSGGSGQGVYGTASGAGGCAVRGVSTGASTFAVQASGGLLSGLNGLSVQGGATVATGNLDVTAGTITASGTIGTSLGNIATTSGNITTDSGTVSVAAISNYVYAGSRTQHKYVSASKFVPAQGSVTVNGTRSNPYDDVPYWFSYTGGTYLKLYAQVELPVGSIITGAGIEFLFINTDVVPRSVVTNLSKSTYLATANGYTTTPLFADTPSIVNGSATMWYPATLAPTMILDDYFYTALVQLYPTTSASQLMFGGMRITYTTTILTSNCS
jgi:hypothetical protein